MKAARRLLLASLLVVACDAAPPQSPEGLDRPNIVLIISDDHGYRDFGFMGSPHVKTPNIDRLAREGSYFPVAYNTASVCRPSLISLLTGLDPLQWDRTVEEFERREREQRRRMPRRPKKRLPMEVQRFATLPRILGIQGYATLQAGKFWEGAYEMAGFSDGLKSRSPVGVHKSEGWAGGGASLAIGRSTMAPIEEFIDAHLTQPFFVWFAPMLPHVPHDAPEEYERLYADSELSKHERRYYANVTRFDAAVGELIAFLDRRGLRERTLIVLLADNGWEAEERDDGDAYFGGAKGKASMYELGWRTPLVFNWPGTIPAGEVKPTLASTLDLFPTFLDYAGANALTNRSGLNLRPVLEGGDPHIRTALYGSDLGLRPREMDDEDPASKPRTPAFFMRTERWHYIWNPDRDTDRLYDLVDDPAETRNVAAAHPELIDGFRADIDDWLESVQVPLVPPQR